MAVFISRKIPGHAAPSRLLSSFYNPGMPDATYIACPRCGEPIAMSAMQKRLYIGRTLACQRCAKPFAITEETPDPAPLTPARVESQSETASVGAEMSDASHAAFLGGSSAPPQPASVAPRRPDGLTAGRMALLILVIACVVGVLLYAAIAPSVHRQREANRRVICESNLTQIGIALQSYGNIHGGRYPDSIEALLADGTIPPSLLVCPSSHDTPAQGNTLAEQSSDFAKGGHQSYAYLGKGMNFGLTKQVLAYEPLDHHDEVGVNVLYTDGTVQFLPRPGALAAIPQLASNAPTTAPASQPAAAPAAESAPTP